MFVLQVIEYLELNGAKTGDFGQDKTKKWTTAELLRARSHSIAGPQPYHTLSMLPAQIYCGPAASPLRARNLTRQNTSFVRRLIADP